MYKLIITDMDGTLLDSSSNIPQNNIDKIIEAQKKGVIIVLASGRVDESMLSYAKTLKMDEFGGYIISYNGSKILNCKTGEVIFYKPITKNQMGELIDLSFKHNICLITYIDKKIYYNIEHYRLDKEVEVTNFEKIKYKSIDDINYELFGKCMYIGEVDQIQKFHEIMKKEKSDEFYTTKSNPKYLEVLNHEANKGKSLEYLVNYLNIELKDVIACGDSYNDSEMLETAGLAVSADNGVKEIKEISDYISVKNNDGVLADVIIKYID